MYERRTHSVLGEDRRKIVKAGFQLFGDLRKDILGRQVFQNLAYFVPWIQLYIPNAQSKMLSNVRSATLK